MFQFIPWLLHGHVTVIITRRQILEGTHLAEDHGGGTGDVPHSGARLVVRMVRGLLESDGERLKVNRRQQEKEENTRDASIVSSVAWAVGADEYVGRGRRVVSV